MHGYRGKGPPLPCPPAPIPTARDRHIATGTAPARPPDRDQGDRDMNYLDDRLAAWNPVRDEDMVHAASSPDAIQLLADILDQPTASAPRSRNRRPRWQARGWMTAAAAVTAAVAAA